MTVVSDSEFEQKLHELGMHELLVLIVMEIIKFQV